MCFEIKKKFHMIPIAFSSVSNSGKTSNLFAYFCPFWLTRRLKLKDIHLSPTFLIKSWEENKMDHIVSFWQPSILFQDSLNKLPGVHPISLKLVVTCFHWTLIDCYLHVSLYLSNSSKKRYYCMSRWKDRTPFAFYICISSHAMKTKRHSMLIQVLSI